MKGWSTGVKHNSGEGNPNVSLTNEEVREIRALRATVGDLRRVPKSHPGSVASIAAKFGVRPGQISNIVLRRQWRHVV